MFIYVEDVVRVIMLFFNWFLGIVNIVDNYLVISKEWLLIYVVVIGVYKFKV